MVEITIVTILSGEPSKHQKSNEAGRTLMEMERLQQKENSIQQQCLFILLLNTSIK